MTNHMRYALLATAAAVAISGTAFATEPGPYLGIGIGIHMPSDSNAFAQVPTGSTPTAFKGEFDTGFLGVGALGYKWDNGFRTELELGYRQADMGKINSVSALGVQKVPSVSANLLYDFNRNSSITPYLGGGLGVSADKWKHVQAPTRPSFTDRTSAFQWQGIAGLSAKVGARTEVFAEYRYISASGNQFESLPLRSVVSGHNDRSHNILVGLRVALGGPKPAPVMAAPSPSPPPPPPPPPPVPRAAPEIPQVFMVFFDFDKSNLRPEAEKIVGEAAAYAKRTGKVVINATGHTDTAGADAYNMALAERRAQSVKAEFVRLGIPASEIAVMAKGESDPLIATGDGVREPQNRRVAIDLR